MHRSAGIHPRMDAQLEAGERQGSQTRRRTGGRQPGPLLGFGQSLELAQLYRRRYSFPQTEREAARYAAAEKLPKPHHPEHHGAATGIQLSLGSQMPSGEGGCPVIFALEADKHHVAPMQVSVWAADMSVHALCRKYVAGCMSTMHACGCAVCKLLEEVRSSSADALLMV